MIDTKQALRNIQDNIDVIKEALDRFDAAMKAKDQIIMKNDLKIKEYQRIMDELPIK